MKITWRRIGCLGCSIVSVLTIAAIAILIVAGADVLGEEFAPLRAMPSTTQQRVEVTASASSITDLAYIETTAIGYSDDADPQDDGIAIDVQFYDSRSEPTTFSDVPITIQIELIGVRDPLEMLESNNGDVVYAGSVSIDHSMRLGEMFGNYIRIPFEEISVDQSIYQPFGRINVTVQTPEHEDFEATWEPVLLYEQP